MGANHINIFSMPKRKLTKDQREWRNARAKFRRLEKKKGKKSGFRRLVNVISVCSVAENFLLSVIPVTEIAEQCNGSASIALLCISRVKNIHKVVQRYPVENSLIVVRTVNQHHI